MIQMPMQHGLPFPKTPLARVDNHGKHITNEWLCYCDFDVLLCGYSIVNLFYRPQRTTIWVPGATMVPAAGACSRTVPLPVIWTSSPAAAACSMTLRTGRPMSDGTRSFFASATVTVAASGGCLAVGWPAAVGALPGAAETAACWVAPGLALAFGAGFAGCAAACDGAAAAGWLAGAGWAEDARKGSSLGRSLAAA